KQYRLVNPCARNCLWKFLILASSAARSSVAGNSSSQIASSFSRRNPSIHCSGTEKFPPPSRYFAAKPQPRKIVTGENRSSRYVLKLACVCLEVCSLFNQSGYRGEEDRNQNPSEQNLHTQIIS